jgi:hypothetical protein
LQEAAQMQSFDTTHQRQFRGALRSNRVGSNHKSAFVAAAALRARQEQTGAGSQTAAKSWDKPDMGLFDGM